jgi:hypothetical protein
MAAPLPSDEARALPLSTVLSTRGNFLAYFKGT